MNIGIKTAAMTACVVAAWIASVTVASAQFLGVQYGPRAFASAPAGTQALSFTYDQMSMGIGVDGTLLSSINNESNSVYLSYTRFLDVAGKSASFTFSLPYVDIASSVETTCCGTFPGLSASDFSDPFAQFNYPLVGGDNLSLQEFFTTEPGLNVTLHAGVRIPIGAYDSTSPLNTGANRWEFRLGLPMSYTWGTPTKQTSLEFVPVAYFFEDNNNPFGAGTVSQDTAYQLELHLTRDFSPAFWGALNVIHVSGGETTTDGVAGDNALDYTGAGLTLGGRLSKTLSYAATYGVPLDTKNASNDGSQFKLGLTYAF